MKQLKKERKIACANLSHRMTGMTLLRQRKILQFCVRTTRNTTQMDRIEMHAKLLDTGTIQMLFSNTVKGIGKEKGVIVRGK